MKFIDANILLYAIDADSSRHEAARRWWDGQLQGSEPVCLCWPVLTAFLRISTNSRIYHHPLTTEEAVLQVQNWITQPCVRIVYPTSHHWQVFSLLLQNVHATSNLVMDAHLVALAMEHDCQICSADSDFALWPESRWTNPLA